MLSLHVLTSFHGSKPRVRAWVERLQPLVAIELVRCVGGAAGRVWMRGILTCVGIRPCERFGGSLLVPRGVARTHQRTRVR